MDRRPSVENVWALVNLRKRGRDQNTLEAVANHLILDHMCIHGDPSHNCFRCVALNSASGAITAIWLSG